MRTTYLLLWGASSCHDGDDYVGIYSDLPSLKKAYDIMIDENTDSGSLKPIIYEFRIINEVRQKYRVVSPSELFNNN